MKCCGQLLAHFLTVAVRCLSLDTLMSQAPCSVPGCEKPVARRGLCWGHHKRLARKRSVVEPLAPRREEKWDAVMDAVFQLINVQDDETSDADWRRAIWRLRRKVQRYKAANPNQHKA